MSVKELGHVVLYVADLDRAKHFYGDVLGWAPAYTGTEPLPYRGMPYNAGGRTHHELMLFEVGPNAAPIPGGRRIGMYHFGVKVGDSDDELRAVWQRLIDNDVPILGASDHGMTHSLYVRDPDGNELEIYVDVPGVDWSDPQLWTSGLSKPLSL